jgi:phosphate transport system substrate-binding protein
LLFTILAVSGIAIAGFVTYMITAIFGGIQFYAPLVITVAAGFAAYSVVSIFNLLGQRTRRICLAAFAGICLLATAGHEIQQAYDNSFTVVNLLKVRSWSRRPDILQYNNL